ncbi:four-helix bundle copper-binding protein [Paraburkholderia sp. CNPSo 3157]|uniref:Four-helix bundle copper-binding protein n=1 Tax=Paraburkholderia franconis TaxID=2654983 RepID=A0A7X1TLB0_9BURK|nr:four-helix bundle copper-binding protein [Paraburkholderia franconis]MPW23445.1 four-helix bundle copper-binding protein [Paraburkholderia franconis]
MNTEPYQSCIEACDACAAACDRCASACLGEPDIAHIAKCIRLNADCASLCRFTSAALARESHLAPEFCALCAQICDECADECSRHPSEQCGTCSDTCRICAEVCRGIWSQ